MLGDNGGLAGLKTVSLRGMGSPHTAVYIDGVKVGNVQSGQGDMGMLDIENFSSVVVDYAQNCVSFNTARPMFGQGSVAGKVRITPQSEEHRDQSTGRWKTGSTIQLMGRQRVRTVIRSVNRFRTLQSIQQSRTLKRPGEATL